VLVKMSNVDGNAWRVCSDDARRVKRANANAVATKS
jgi:hypothetical protein